MDTSLKQFAEQLADRARAAILPHYRNVISVENKSEHLLDPVTEADRAAERAMRALINSHYPDHGIIGEEYGQERSDAEYVWVLDPIDGTKAFIAGLPMWGTLIGLLHRNEAKLGIIDQAFLGERFVGIGSYAMQTKGIQTKALKTRACPSLRQAQVWIGGTMSTHPLLPALIELLQNEVGMLRIGADAYAVAMQANGLIDVIIDGGLAIYDVAAHIPLLQAAGGVACSWHGGNALDSPYFLSCGDMALRDPLVRLLSSLL